jgi:DNA-directed RNA polymerase subunit beta'
MSEDDYDAKRKEYGDEFVALMGAEGIKELLEASTSTSRSRSCATT